MNFATSIRTCFSKYVTFSGRASRSEYWWFFLFYFVADIAANIVDSTMFGTVTTTGSSFEASTNTPILTVIFSLAVILPSISVMVRRLHDLDKSGWWYWIVLVPIVGVFMVIYWLASEGTDGPNRFDPLDGQNADSNADGDFVKSGVPTISRD